MTIETPGKAEQNLIKALEEKSKSPTSNSMSSSNFSSIFGMSSDKVSICKCFLQMYALNIGRLLGWNLQKEVRC